ncbi:hypothetical protein NFI96_028238 [Prochilodus magdalenae]|nr:hypothetical protein NFI96_028238 [Prochilodus magdalenae]
MGLHIRFKENGRKVLEGYFKLLLKKVWSHTIVLFTCGDWLGDTPIEQHIESEGKELQWLVEKCGNRYHVLNNKNRSDDTQVTELLEKIEEMVAANGGRHFEMNRKILQEVEEKRRAEEERVKERLTRVQKQKEEIRTLVGDSHHLSELRIVLLGYIFAGKSSAGNTILNREEFELKRTAQCVKRQGEVAGRHITVVEAPGWWRDKPVKENTELLKQEIVLSVSLCPPGPHAVLLIIRVDCGFDRNDRSVLEGYLKLLTDTVWSHTIVLFTCGDCLGDTPIEQHIESEGKELQWVVEICWNRYHVLNNKNRSDDSQITELLEKIEEMVAANSGRHFEMDRKILQEVEEKRRAEEERVKERMVKVQKQHIRSLIRDSIRLLELRIVLLGNKYAGKSSVGNTILNREEFELKSTSQCVKRQGEVAGRHITVVEAPGWWRDSPVERSADSLKQEIVLSVSLCPPGPHAVLIFVRVDCVFERSDRSILEGYLKLLIETVWSHTIVLFTFGDCLGDTPIEQHIESEGKELQCLVEKCGNRYHVLNNKNRSDGTQVTELLEKIEEMVAANGGRHFEVDRKILQKVKEKKTAEDQNEDFRSLMMTKDERLDTLSLASSGYFSMSGSESSSVYGSSYSFESLVHDPKHPKFKLPKRISSLLPFLRRKKGFRCPHAGQFQCRLTNLIFEMEGKGELLYRIDSWDTRLLDGLDQMQPAGPLYNIECTEGSISRLHLPHCELLSEENQPQLVVAHFTEENMEAIPPLEVTNTHVIISTQHLSLFGLLKKMMHPGPINAQVLVFYKEMMSKQSFKKLHIHLLPGNVPFEEVEKKHKGTTYFETSSTCQLTAGNNYKPSCDPHASEPKVARFVCDYGPNYHPTFVVYFEAEDITVSILDEDGVEVWEPHQIFLKSKNTSAKFVDENRETLIQKVSSVMEIADCLQSKTMITDEMYSNIQTAKTSQEQMRILYRALDSGGTTVKKEFHQILKRKLPFLVDELESKPLLWYYRTPFPILTVMSPANQGLALVCPDPISNSSVALLVGTNTQIIRKLFDSCRTQGGERFLNTLTIHPIIRKAYESLQDTDASLEDSDQKGTIWFDQSSPVTLQPSQVLRVADVPKLSGELTNSLLLVDQAEAVNNSERHEVHSASVLSQKRVVVTVRNVSSKPVILRRGTPLANIFPVMMVPQLKAPTSETTSTLSPSSFDFGDSPMPDEAKQRLCQKMLERRDVWDVGCSNSTKHEIRLTDLKPFRERSHRLAPAEIEDVRKHLQELKENGIISDSRSP